MKSQNITFKKKQSKWMLLYSMSENQLKKIWDYLNENLKREFIKLSKLLTEYLILFVSKEWMTSNCVLTINNSMQ
jgi:hypothetical protein